MTFLIPSCAEALGSTYLTTVVAANAGAVLNMGTVTFGAAFIHHQSMALLHQGTISAARYMQEYQDFETYQTIALTACVIAFRVLASYSMISLLKRHLDVVVTKNFVHVTNVLFLAAVAQIEFELTAKEINPKMYRDVTDKRAVRQLFNLIAAIRHHIALQ